MLRPDLAHHTNAPTSDSSAVSATETPARGLSITALVLGVVGLVFPIGGIFGIGSLVCGTLALKNGESRGLALTGTILGAASLVITVVIWVVFAWAVAAIFTGPTAH